MNITCPRCRQSVRVTPSIRRHVQLGGAFKCTCGLPLDLPPEVPMAVLFEAPAKPIEVSQQMRPGKNRARHKGPKT